MRDWLLYIAIVILLLLIGITSTLPEDKKITTQTITVINNEKLLSKNIRSFSCSDSICYKYYANFLSSSQEITKDTYYRIKEGNKVSLNKTDKSLSLLSILLLVAIVISTLIIFTCLTQENEINYGGEYYG